MHNSEPASELSIISALDREWCEEMPLYIAALEKQRGIELSRFEVHVVNGTGDNQVDRQISDFKASYGGPLRIQFHTIEKCGRAAASNYAISRSRGDVMLLLADDFLASPNLVSSHFRLHLEHPDQTVVAVGPAVFPSEWELSLFMHWLETSGSLFGVPFAGEHAAPPGPDFFYGANTSIKRSFFEKAGGFDEDYPYACWDDFELSIRLKKLGMQTYFLEQARAVHWHRITLSERCGSMRHAGESAAIMDFKYGGIERLKISIRQRRKIRRRTQPRNHEERWKLLLNDEFNKAYKRVAKNLITSGLLKKAT